ncbi:AMIN domain-containing protein [Acidobacteriota bacterium]
MTGNKVWGKRILLSVLLMCCFLMFGFGVNEISQDVKSPLSFYENLLISGEEAFLSGEYQRAIKELEIAAFGLYHRKNTAAKAYVLISLSYYHLENRVKADEYLKEAALLVSVDELRTIEPNIDGADRNILESLIQDADVSGEGAVLPALEEKTIPEQEKKEPEKKKKPETVDERITQLVEERKKQQAEQLKEKAEIPEKKEMAKKPAEKGQEVKTQIEGMEEIFILDEPVQKSILSEIRIQKGTNSIDVGILFQPFTEYQVFEIIDSPPKRIVIDLFNIAGIKTSRSIDINDFGITSVRTGMFKPDVARVVFDALGDLPTYRIEEIKGGLRVVIEKSPL